MTSLLGIEFFFSESLYYVGSDQNKGNQDSVTRIKNRHILFDQGH